MIEKLKSLHACWCETTGQQLNLRATERIFYEVAVLEFTPDDLLCVLKFVMAYNKTHAAAPMKLQAHKLLGDLEVFASILADARARERNKVVKPTPKEIVLREFRGITPEKPGNCIPIKAVFDKLREVTQ